MLIAHAAIDHKEVAPEILLNVFSGTEYQIIICLFVYLVKRFLPIFLTIKSKDRVLENAVAGGEGVVCFFDLECVVHFILVYAPACAGACCYAGNNSDTACSTAFRTFGPSLLYTNSRDETM